MLVEEGEEPGEVQVVQAGVARESKFKQIFTSRIVHYMAMFSIIYIGVEVTVGGQSSFQYFRLQALGLKVTAHDQVGLSRSSSANVRVDPVLATFPLDSLEVGLLAYSM